MNYRTKDYEITLDGTDFPGLLSSSVSPRAGSASSYSLAGQNQQGINNDDGADVTFEFQQMAEDDLKAYNAIAQATRSGPDQGVQLVIKHRTTGAGCECRNVVCDPVEANVAEGQQTIRATANAGHYAPTPR